MQSDAVAGQEYQIPLGHLQLSWRSGRQAEAEAAEQRDQAHLHLHPSKPQANAVARSVTEAQEGSGMTLPAGIRCKSLRPELVGLRVHFGVVVDGQHRNVRTGALLQDDGVAAIGRGDLIVLGGETCK